MSACAASRSSGRTHLDGGSATPHPAAVAVAVADVEPAAGCAGPAVPRAPGRAVVGPMWFALSQMGGPD